MAVLKILPTRLGYLLITLWLLFIWSSLTRAQPLTIEVAGVGTTKIPIAIAHFSGGQPLHEVIQSDLTRSGYFRSIPTQETLLESDLVNYATWQQKGAAALAIGTTNLTPDGRLIIRYRLFDVSQSRQLSGLEVIALPTQIRIASHRIANDIYEKLLGIRGVFDTRMAYITHQSDGHQGNIYQLVIADADGESTQVALRSPEPIMSPAWSPDGKQVAYVSFESQKAVVYVQNLVTQARTVVANFKGSNSSPTWSPDGKQLAIALAKDGLTQIYLVNTDGTDLRAITQTKDIINTEPQFSPDGQSIYFMSERSGGAQIFKMNRQGGQIQRITRHGSHNVSPRLSPDGKTLVYVSRRDKGFQIYALDLATHQEIALSEGTDDQSPSFSPNGQYVLYATGLSTNSALAVVSLDGRIRQTIGSPIGRIITPTWGPFMQ